MKSYYRSDYKSQQESYHRARRRRRGARLATKLALLVAAVAVTAVLVSAWSTFGSEWFRARFAAMSFFRIEEVLVSGNGTLPRQAVLDAAGLAAGENLLGLDLAAARARLLTHPWIREAGLRRRLPSTLLVEIQERVPLLIVRADRDYLVDGEGVILEALDSGKPAAFPVLTGVDMVDGRLSLRGAGDLAVGLELIATIRDEGFPVLEAVSFIDLADPDDARIVPVAGRPIVHAGRGDYATRLRRWKLVASDMARRWPELEYVDLRAEGQVIALPSAPVPAEQKSLPGEAGKASGTPSSTHPQSGAGEGRGKTGGRNA